MVIDCGNGNIKVMVGNEYEIIPSLYSSSVGNGIRGGFKLGEKDYIVGWDNLHRVRTAKSTVDLDDGKIKMFDILLCGTLSAMRDYIPEGAAIDLHILTLNQTQGAKIIEKVNNIKDFSIDGKETNYQLSVAKFYAEGFGACVYAQDKYPGYSRVAVLDIGNGTLNISVYHNGRRESLEYASEGYKTIIEGVAELIHKDTSNGDVNEGLIRTALDRNHYEYRKSYEPRDIRCQTDKAIEAWLGRPKVERIILQVRNLLEQKIPVVVCGGGFQCQAIVEAVQKVIGENELFNVPENPIMLGVAGLYNKLTK